MKTKRQKKKKVAKRASKPDPMERTRTAVFYLNTVPGCDKTLRLAAFFACVMGMPGDRAVRKARELCS